MALPLLPTVFRVAITHGTPTAPTHTNVIHVSSAVLTPAQVLSALDGAVAPGIFDPTGAAISVHSAVVTKLDNLTPSVEGTLASAGWNGTGAGEVSPASAAVITLRTGERGRRHTGRVYVGYIAEDKMQNGQLTPATLATMNAAWVTFLANLITAGIPLNVTSYGHDGAAPPPPRTRPAFAASTTLVTSASSILPLGTQRRRQSKLR